MLPESSLRLLLVSAAIVATSLPLAGQAPSVEVVEVADTLSSAIGVTHAGDGSGRLFVVQQPGEIRIWDGAEVLLTPFLDISSLVTPSGFERGLLGLAFHPDYAANGFFYVNYTDSSGDTVVARYSVSGGDPDVADPLSAVIVLSFPQTAPNHNGGDMHFGPDGYLYLSSGDGGGDWCDAQDPGNLLGTMLRIDVDGDDFPGDANANYAVPAGNPFVGVPGAREEIWSLGLRNPWRFSFDRASGDLLIGDVGAGTWEEVSIQPAASGGGENYGWPWFEGPDAFNSCANPSGGPFTDCDDAPFTCPILALNQDDGNCSMIGGFRYRGPAYPALTGFYFYTDWCGGTLWAAEPDGPSWTSYPVANLGGGYTGFGEDEDGELYIVNGNLLVHIALPSAIFDDGFESGSTSTWSATVP